MSADNVARRIPLYKEFLNRKLREYQAEDEKLKRAALKKKAKTAEIVAEEVVEEGVEETGVELEKKEVGVKQQEEAPSELEAQGAGVKKKKTLWKSGPVSEKPLTENEEELAR